ncbi:MAG: hypothetical protein CMK89_22495 [Pseudomonadales bacterium]|nr:hypothetical protein [Pseudomonadales bacterium]
MQRRSKGFTMVELLITLAIAAIILALATPSFLDLMEKNRVRSTAEQLTDLFRLSRVVAVEQRLRVSVCGSSDNTNCDDDWDSSILSIKKGDSVDEVLGTLNISSKVSVSKNGTHPEVEFRESGWAPGDSSTITICPVDGDQRNAYKVIVRFSGKVRMQANTDNESWC